MSPRTTSPTLESMVNQQELEEEEDERATLTRAQERERLQANLKAKRAHSRTQLESQVRAEDAKLHKVLPDASRHSDSDSLVDSDESLVDSEDEEPIFESTILAKTRRDPDYLSVTCIAIAPNTLQLDDDEFDASFVKSYQRKGGKMLFKIRRLRDGTPGSFEAIRCKLEAAVASQLEEALQELATEGFVESQRQSSSYMQSP